MHGDERGLGRQHHARFLKASTIEPRLRLISRCEVFTGLYAWKSRSQSPGVQDQGEASITDLPPIVVSDFFGVHPNTAYSWAQFARNSWAEYLEAVAT